MTERDVPRVPHLLDGDGDASSLMRAALRGARADLPDAAKMNAMSVAIASAVSGDGGGGEPPGEGGTGAGGALGAGSGPLAPGAVGATKLALSAVAVVAAIGVALFAARPGAPVDPVGDAGPTTTASAPPTAVMSVTPKSNEAVLDVHALPPAPAARRAAPSVTATTSAAESPASPEAEMTLLRSAQNALVDAPADALARCNEHASIYPSGALADEREVLAVDALMRLGRRSEAETRAARFRVAHSGSAYLRRLDTLLGKPN